MVEAMAEEAKLNYIYLTKKAKTDKKQVKKNLKKRQAQVKYNCRQSDQYHAIKIADQPTILNSKEFSILKKKKKVLRLQINL